MQNLKTSWHIATRSDVALRAAKIALIVGIVIALINHGDKMAMGAMDPRDWMKCALTFVVPYCVSTWSQIGALQTRGETK